MGQLGLERKEEGRSVGFGYFVAKPQLTSPPLSFPNLADPTAKVKSVWDGMGWDGMGLYGLSKLISLQRQILSYVDLKTLEANIS